MTYWICLGLSISALIVSAIVLIAAGLGRRLKSRVSFFFFYLVLFNLLSALPELPIGLLIGTPGVGVRVVLKLLNYLTYVFSSLSIIAFANYVYEYLSIKATVSRRPLQVATVIGCANLVLTAIAEATNLYSWFDELNNYHQTDLFWVGYVPYVAVFAICSFMLTKHIKALRMREWVVLMLYGAIPCVCYLLESLYEDVWIAYLGVAVVSLLIYIAIQVELMQKIQKQNEELIKSRTAIMLSQIQPHFLYNTLSSIEYLCETGDPKQAGAAIGEFSEYLRGNMDSLAYDHPIPFERELSHVKLYLSLEEKSDGDRVHADFDIQTTAFLLPALTLQPIVENAVTHGVTKRQGGSLDGQLIDNNDGIIDNGSIGGTIGGGTVVDGGIVTLPVINNGVIYGSTFDPADGEPDPAGTGTVRYRVSFIMHGHGEQVPHQDVELNGTAVLPTRPTETGWVFGGWHSDKAMTALWRFPTDTVDSNMMLFAAWAECDHSGSTATPTCTHGAACSLCGAALAATGHDYQISATVAATCTADGYITHTCTRCDDSYKVDNGKATGHSWGSWKSSADGKTEKRSCSACGATETRNADGTQPGPADPDPADTTPPTDAGANPPPRPGNSDVDEDGTDTEGGQNAGSPVDGGELGPVSTGTTTVYGYGSGAIIITITGADGQPAMVTVTDSEAFARAEAGETVEIELSVIHIYADVPKDDKALLEGALEEYARAIEGLEMGMYLDISLRYRMSDGAWISVAETAGEIELAIDIPDELLAEDATYFLLRAHGGAAALLQDLDGEAATVTIKTNLFSSYALAYTLAEVTDAALKAADEINRHQAGVCGLCGFCPHPLGVCVFLWLLAAAVAVTVIVVVNRKKRKA